MYVCNKFKTVFFEIKTNNMKEDFGHFFEVFSVTKSMRTAPILITKTHQCHEWRLHALVVE